MKYVTLSIFTLLLHFGLQAQQSTQPSTQPSQLAQVTEFVDDNYVAYIAKTLNMPLEKQKMLLEVNRIFQARRAQLLQDGAWEGTENEATRLRFKKEKNKATLDALGKNLYKKKTDLDGSDFVKDAYISALAKALDLPLDKQMEMLDIKNTFNASKAKLMEANKWQGTVNEDNRFDTYKTQKKAYLQLLGKGLNKKKADFDKTYNK